jgi:hypothetical protein
MSQPDGMYNYKPWDQPPAWQYLRPWASNEERLTQQAIEAAMIPAEELTDMVRPPLSQVQLFPPRFGYRTRTIGIDDIMDVDRNYAAPVPNFAGGPAGYSGTSRNSLGSV